MPVARYFLYVGGVLLALLFAVDLLVPQDAVVATHGAPGVDRSMVRIASTQKLPERVVYDTNLPTIVPPASVNVAGAKPAPAPAAEASAQSRVRETFAQYVPGESKKLEPQAAKKRKVARAHTNRPMYQYPVRVAQQSRFGFFGMPMWNNTW